MENHSDIVTLLVQKSANAQYRHRGTGNVALHEAAAKGNLESVRVRSPNGCSYNNNNIYISYIYNIYTCTHTRSHTHKMQHT